MPVNNKRQFFLIILFVAFFLTITANNVYAADTQKHSVIKSGSVAVMPFLTGEYSNDIEKGRPPLQFKFDDIVAVEESKYPNGEKILTKLMNEALQKKLAQQLISQSTVSSEFKNINIDHKTDTTLSVAVRLGKNLHVDYVVVGIVWDYKDRIGSKLAAAEPATVSFSAFLVDVAAGKRIWRERYTKTQQSLSGNLLKAPEFFKQGAKWLTAEELSRIGIKEILVSFPL